MDTGYKISTGEDIKTLFAPISSGTPSGCIIAYLGTTDVEGWILCNGDTRTNNSDSRYNGLNSLGIGIGGGGISDYTPPLLTNCVLRGNDGALNTIAGANFVTLTTTNIPAHSHTGTTDSTNIDHEHDYSVPRMDININQGDGNGLGSGQQRANKLVDTLKTKSMTNQNHTHTFTTSSAGSGTKFSIVPLHYKVNYLIKL